MTESPGMWIVITGSAIGAPVSGYSGTHASDLREFVHRESALFHGFTMRQSGDFNLGLVRDGKLESIWWMDENLGEDADTLAAIGREIGLVAS